MDEVESGEDNNGGEGKGEIGTECGIDSVGVQCLESLYAPICDIPHVTDFGENRVCLGISPISPEWCIEGGDASGDDRKYAYLSGLDLCCSTCRSFAISHCALRFWDL
jgi:hypothetical protein